MIYNVILAVLVKAEHAVSLDRTEMSIVRRTCGILLKGGNCRVLRNAGYRANKLGDDDWQIKLTWICRV